MHPQLLARPYAESLYSLLKEGNLLDEVMEEYKWLVQFTEEETQLRAFLETPRISRVAKQGFVEKCLRGKCSDTFVNFLQILIKKGRIFLLANVYREVHEYQELEGDKIRIVITTALPLSEETREQIVKEVEEKYATKSVVEEIVDPDILGGVIIRVQDTLINGSLKYQLDKIRDSILERSKTYGL